MKPKLKTKQKKPKKLTITTCQNNKSKNILFGIARSL